MLNLLHDVITWNLQSNESMWVIILGDLSSCSYFIVWIKWELFIDWNKRGTNGDINVKPKNLNQDTCK